MALFKSGKRYFKVYVKCSTPVHGGVVVAVTKDADLAEKIKNKDLEVLKRLYGDACDRCLCEVDEIIDSSDIRKIKKIYTVKEL